MDSLYDGCLMRNVMDLGFMCGVVVGVMKGIMRMMGDLNFVRKWWPKGDLEVEEKGARNAGQFLKQFARADPSSLE